MLTSRRSWIGLGLLVGLGALLRFYRLDTLPPGLFGDEALVSLQARDTLVAQSFPVYFAAPDGGFHPAIVYLTLLARWLTGNHILAVRFGVAAVGVISIPIVYFALHAIFRLDERPPLHVSALAFLGAFIYTIAFPSILIQRLGFEVMLPAPAGALAFLGLAVALRTQQKRHYALAGLALGLGLYTYYSARLLPVAMVIVLVWVAGMTRQWRRALSHLAILTVAAAIAFAPLGLFFLKNPSMFLARAAVTSQETLGTGWTALPLTLLRSTFITLGGLSLAGFGDALPRHNYPGRPAFDAFLSLLFWLGVAGAALNRKRPSSVLLGTWASAMLLPVVLTLTGGSPHFTRMAGAMPALAGIGALGGSMIYDAIGAQHRRAAAALIGFGLAFSVGVSVYDYFFRWANDVRLFDAFQVGDWQAAVLAQKRAATRSVFLSPALLSDNSRATFNLMLSGGPVRDIPGRNCLAYWDRPAQPLTYIVDVLNDKQTPGQLRALFPSAQVEPAILSQDKTWELYEIIQVPAGASAWPPAQRTAVVFGDTLELIGYGISPSTPKRGEPSTVVLYWRTLAHPTTDYTVFVHFYPPVGDIVAPVAQSDSAPCQGRFPTSGWSAGEVVMDAHTLTLPSDFASDSVVLGLGVYTWPSLQRIPPALLAGEETATLLPENRVRLAQLSLAR